MKIKSVIGARVS